MTPIRLLILPATADQTCRQILFGPEDHVMEDQRLDYGGPWLGDTPAVLAVPGADVLARRLVLPAGSRAQVEAAATMILEEDLASTHETLRVAVGPVEADGARLVVAASANRVQAWMEIARALGAEPAVVIPDYLLLPEPAEDDDAVLALDLGDRIAARGRDIALSAEPDLLPLLLQERDTAALEPGPALLAAFVRAVRSPMLDLKPRPPAEGLNRRAMRLAAALAALALISPLVLDGARAARDDGAARRDEAQALGLARSVLGSGAAIDDPAAQVRARRLELNAGAGFGDSAAGLFAALESVESAKLEALMFDPSGVMRATVSYADYADVERLRGAAATHGLALEEISALDERGVRIGAFVVRPA
ncbi:type II secretion system protein GspL [Brevundimonas sp.]|uniref:type II secretion system protein GspL n=1 Tax=Brevundimonas sp. TaxID=1871086 RepID=UPI0025D4DE50|nr:type II secretion system protein GspL [Brevundimonas sp.]